MIEYDSHGYKRIYAELVLKAQDTKAICRIHCYQNGFCKAAPHRGSTSLHSWDIVPKWMFEKTFSKYNFERKYTIFFS